MTRYEEALKAHIYLLENDGIHELTEALFLTASILRRSFEEAARLSKSVIEGETTTCNNWLIQAQRLETLSQAEQHYTHSVTDNFTTNHSLTLNNLQLCNIILHCDALNFLKSPTEKLGFYINSDRKSHSFYFVTWEQYINLLTLFKATDPVITNGQNWNLMQSHSNKAQNPSSQNKRPHPNEKPKGESVPKILSICGPQFLEALENPYQPNAKLPYEVNSILQAASTDEMERISSISASDIYSLHFDDLEYLESRFFSKFLNDEIVAFEALFLSSMLIAEFPKLKIIINRYLKAFHQNSLSSLYSAKIGPSIFIVLKALELGIWIVNKNYQVNRASLTNLGIVEVIGSEIDNFNNCSQELNYEIFQNTKDKILEVLPNNVEPPFLELSRSNREVAIWRNTFRSQKTDTSEKSEWSSNNRIQGTLRLKKLRNKH